MSTLTPARTYNQNHVARKYAPGKRRLSIYWTWSYPWESQRDPAAMENRFSTMTEVRNVLWPDYETPEWSAAQFLQGIAGTLELFHRSTLSFQQIAGEVTGQPVAVFQRIDQAGYKLPIDERILADTDTLLVFGLDHLLSEQEATPEEIAAIREWLKREGTCLLLAPHHDVGFTADKKQQQMEYLHHGDRLVPRQQRFGQYTRSLMKALEVPVHNTCGLRPALVKGSKDIAPLTAFRDMDKLGLLNNVPTLNFHPHLPHYEITAKDAKSVHLLARQPIDLDRPHPFTEAGNTEFNCLLWMPPNEQRAGDIVLLDSTNFTTLFGGHGKSAKPLAEFRSDELNAANCAFKPFCHGRMKLLYVDGGDIHVDGTVEQGSDGGHAELRRVEHARDGCRSHRLSDFRAASQYAAGLLALVANFVVMPLGALALAKVLSLDEPFGVGLLLLGCAAGAPFLPKLAELAKGNLAFAVGAMVLLMVTTVVYLPVVLPLLLPGVTVNAWGIARSLVLLMLLPLAVGLALKARYGDLAARVKPTLDWISNISLILLVCLITAANIDKVLQVFGTGGILAGLLFIALGFATGWLLGGPDADTKRVMALGTGQRNIAAALVVASQGFSDPKVVVMVIVVAIAGLIILMPLSRALAESKGHEPIHL